MDFVELSRPLSNLSFLPLIAGAGLNSQLTSGGALVEVSVQSVDEKTLGEALSRLRPLPGLFTIHYRNKRSTFVLLRAQPARNFRETYNRGIAVKAMNTPHGHFWSLKQDDLRGAIRFLTTYGPLTTPLFPALASKHDWVAIDLSDFWERQRLFRAVTSLWLCYEREDPLRRALLALHAELRRRPSREFTLRCDKSWIETASFRALKGQSVEVLNDAFVAQSLKSSVFWTLSGSLDGQSSRPRFEFSIEPPDRLWNVLWFLFAVDSVRKNGMRYCTHCDAVFYPPRRDRFYCTTAIQSQYSKNRWWKENGPQQLAKRKALRKGSTAQ